MPYATRTLMVELYGARTLGLMTSGSEDAIDYVELDAKMKAADIEVDGYLQGVRSLNQESIPESLRLHACRIAYYLLDTDAPTEGAKLGYQSAIRYLERVQAGKSGLGRDEAGQPVQRDDQVFATDVQPQAADLLKGF